MPFWEILVKRRTIALFVNLLLAFLTQVSIATADPLLLRGPYLQKTSSSSTVVRWRTNVATSSRVKFGRELGNLANEAIDSAVTTEHRVSISGLEAGTRYYYQIESDSAPLLAANDSLFFETNPSTTSTRPVRVWVLGDSGRGNAGQRAVYQGYAQYAAATKRSDLILMLGDNAYDVGLDSEYQSKLFDIYKETIKNTTLWPTFGNHDGQNSFSSSLIGPYYDSFSLPREGEAGGLASGTEAYYSFDYGPVHFICLNSYDVDRDANGVMANWLKADLAATNRLWKVAYWHHPPYSKGSRDSDLEPEQIQMRENIVPILEDGGVDLVLGGHSHAYERSKLVDGHYGPSSSFLSTMVLDGRSGDPSIGEGYHKPRLTEGHRGTVYLVAGNSALVTAAPLNHPIMSHSSLETGSLVLDIESNRLEGRLIGPDGAVKELFRIEKDCYSEGACPLLPRVPVVPFVDATLIGKKSGKIRNVQKLDGKYQILKSARITRRGKNYGVVHLQSFIIPAGFAVERHILVLKTKKGIPLKLRFSYSLDGASYLPFAETDTLSGYSSALDLPLPHQLTERVWLKLESIPIWPRSDRMIDIRIDQSILY